MSKSFNVVIATAGRSTLQRMVDSIAPQLSECDYLTIIWDSQPIDLQIESKCKVIFIQNEEPLGYWGHGSRTKWQNELPGDYLMNADDDDVYAKDAMDIVRSYCRERKLYIFQFIVNYGLVPISPDISLGNIGTPCGVYPNTGSLPDWRLEYGGDCQFYLDLSKTLPVQFVMKPIYAVHGNFEVGKPDPRPPVVQCTCGQIMAHISVGGVQYAACPSCRKEIEL